MLPFVLQLQAECLDSQVSILEVLRKALVVAHKLEMKDELVWIEKELNGYEVGDTIPAYRHRAGRVRLFNPYRS